MDTQILHTVYKTTNLVNGKFYIGYHSTLDPWDEYLGSGVSLGLAIKRYGIANFKKIVLYIGLSEKLALEKERQHVGWLYMEEYTDCYNLAPGGGKGPITFSMRGRNHSETSRNQMSLAKTGMSFPNRKKPANFSEEHRANISKANIGKHIPSTAHLQKLKEYNTGKIMSEETKRRVSESKLLSSTTAKGQENGNAKLSEGMAREIINKYKNGAGCVKLAAEYNVNRNTIRHIVTGITWKYLHIKGV